MNFRSFTSRPPKAEYARAVDFLLEHRYATSIEERRAEELMTAAWRAGHTPREFVELLAELDGLQRQTRE